MFVLLGSHGQISSQLARRLLAAGHRVRIVGRNAAALAPLAKAGAEPALGDAADAAFLARAFTGAQAAYTMLPPNYGEPDMRAAQDRIGSAIARALTEVPVPRVVNLSSIGAELAAGTGPIEGLHAQEQRLQALRGIELLHLRPGSFMENLLPGAAVAAATGVLPGMEAPDIAIPMVATQDIASVAARELATPQRSGVLELHGPRHLTLREAAAVLGAAMGRPDLPYVQSTPDEGKAALRANGLSVDAAEQIAALAHWLSTTAMASVGVVPFELQPTTLEAFARQVLGPVSAIRATAVA